MLVPLSTGWRIAGPAAWPLCAALRFNTHPPHTHLQTESLVGWGKTDHSLQAESLELPGWKGPLDQTPFSVPSPQWQ